nr:hypothetical protein [uncultured Cohaesibacter sp.]
MAFSPSSRQCCHAAMGSLAGVLFLLGLPVLAKADNCDRIHYGTELVDDVTYCASSVLPNSRVATYRPGNLEGWGLENAHRAWCEGAYGSGQGEWIALQVRPGTRIRKVMFLNGYQKSTKSYQQNARARDITIETDKGARFDRRLDDRPGVQEIDLNGWHDVSTLRVYIETIYPGSKYDDLCLSGMALDFEDIRDFEYQQQ